MNNTQETKKLNSEILRDGLANLLGGKVFESSEEHDIVIDFMKTYGLKLPTYFTHSMPVELVEGDNSWKRSIIDEIIENAVNTYISMYSN